MTNRKTLRAKQSAVVGAALLAGLVIGMTGCKKEEAPPPVARDVAPPPPPAPVKPAVTPIDDLMAQLGIDDRIMLLEEDAPATNEDRIALLTFFDAMVRGDDQTVGDMISELDREQLNILVENGQWQETTDEITMVELRTGADPGTGENVVLGLITVDVEMQPQMWVYRAEGDNYRFDAVPGPSDILEKISGFDLIAEWFAYLDEEMNVLAYKPDEEIDMRVSRKDKSESSAGGSSGGDKAPPKRKRSRRKAPGLN